MRNILLTLSVFIALTGCAQTKTSEQGKATQPAAVEKKATVKATELTTDQFCKKILDIKTAKTWEYKGTKPAIIDFHAPWCGPCRKMGPIFDKLANEYAGQVEFYKVNIDNEQQLAQYFGISSIPALLFIPAEGEPQGAMGLIPEENLKQAIDSLLLKKK